MTVLIPSRRLAWAPASLAALSAGLGLSLAAHYPLSAVTAVLLWLLAAGLAWRFWAATPALFALLPVLGFASWSGWITFEELDLLVLACAAGAYAALAWPGVTLKHQQLPAWRKTLGYSPLVLLLMGLFAASVLWSVRRGLADAGGFSFGWFQGYHEAMNSIRQGKSYFLALLLVPVWVQAAASQPRRLSRAVVYGLAGALALASLAALWERQAFTGLINFSSDYRTTALFWEMHVGGAAFDGCLALSMPFALLLLLRAQTPTRFAWAMLLLLLGAYACLTTFSRGVYLAVPVSLAVLLALRELQGRRALKLAGPGAHVNDPVSSTAANPATQASFGLLLVAAAFTVAAVLMFFGSGYRGLLALLGGMFVLLLMPAEAGFASPAQRAVGLLTGALVAAVLAALSWVLSMEVAKAAYVIYLLAFAVALLLRYFDQPERLRPVYAMLMAASWFWLMACALIVADYWGGEPGRASALLALLAPALLWPLMQLWPALWPFGGRGPAVWRRRGLMFGSMALVTAVIATLLAGSYMRDRSTGASSRNDMQVRIEHWKNGIALLVTPEERWLGKGVGRYVANLYFNVPAAEQTGDYRLKTEVGQHYLALTAGKHVQGWGEMFRVSQRVAAPQGQVKLTARVRAEMAVGLHVEICEKHLLYNEACLVKELQVAAQPGVWQTLALDLGSAPAMGGAWYAPKLIVFSVAVASRGGMADLAEMQLSDGRSPALLANADFADEMAHWFFSSDRHHMPWHIKQMALHVMFEQGFIGLGLLAALVAVALWRLSAGRGRAHELAPALAAGLLGFIVVGLFDSLLDVPRMAYLFYALLLLSLGLRGTAGAEAKGR
jgi:hypothetical protein